MKKYLLILVLLSGCSSNVVTRSDKGLINSRRDGFIACFENGCISATVDMIMRLDPQVKIINEKEFDKAMDLCGTNAQLWRKTFDESW